MHSVAKLRRHVETALRPRIKEAARHAGFDLVRYFPLAQMLENREVSVVFDVGANDGRFGSDLRHRGFRGRIVSFEPASEPFRLLATRASADGLWDASRIALGEADGKARLRLSTESEFNSFLASGSDSDTWDHGRANQVAEEPVSVCRFDRVFHQHCDEATRSFLKIDTQGYDLQVLKGAETILDRLVGVQVELALAPLYAGQPAIDEVLAFLKDRGFSVWTFHPVFTDPETGRLTEVDGVFFRP